MTKRSSKFIVAAIITVSVISILWWRGTGPTYHGRSVRYWISQYHDNDSPRDVEALNAFRVLGDRAVPALLQSSLRAGKPTAGERAYSQFRAFLPQSMRWRLPPTLRDNEWRTDPAGQILQIIRPSAHAMLLELRPLLSSPANQDQYRQAVWLLGTLGQGGSNAVPFLIKALKSTDQWTRRVAIQSLGYLGSNSVAAVQDLIIALQDPATRTQVITTLGNVGPGAKSAVPHLRPFLQSAEQHNRAASLVALHKIDPQGGTLKILLEGIQSGADPDFLSTALHSIRGLRSDAVAVVPYLLAAMKDPKIPPDQSGNPQWIRIIDILHQISPSNREPIPILLEKLERANAAPNRWSPAVVSERMNIAAWLVRLDPAQPEGLADLTEVIQSNPYPGSRLFPIDVLAELGQHAKTAAPALRTALVDKDPRVRESAAAALKKIRLSASR